MNLIEQMHRLSRVIEKAKPPVPLKSRAPRTAYVHPDNRRENYQQDILNALRGQKSVSSVDVGRATGVGRITACKRLQVLAQNGLVAQVGSGVKTKWRLL